MRRAQLLAVLGLVLTLSIHVQGQEYNEALATELFNAGRELMTQGQYQQACPKLGQSAKLFPAVGALGKLAECEEQLDQLVKARGHLQQALNLAKAQSDPRLGVVEQELARIDSLVPKLQLAFESTNVEDLKVRVDDVELEQEALELPIPLDPGNHTVIVSAPGRVSSTHKVKLTRGEGVTRLAVKELVNQAKTPSPPSPAPVASTEREPTSSPLAPVGLVVAGVGAVSMGVGAYFGGLAKSKLDESNVSGCAGDRCTPQAASIRNDARDYGNMSTIFFAAGGVLAAGGLGLFLFAPSEGGHAVMTPTAGPDLTGVRLQGAF